MMDDKTKSLNRALEMARRSLEILEEQAAGFTSLTMPVHLRIDLEEKRRQVKELEERLNAQVTPHEAGVDLPGGDTIIVGNITGSGIAIGRGAQAHSRDSSQREEKPEAEASLIVNVDLLTRFFPTAYSHHLDSESFPFVIVNLENPSRQQATARASAFIQGYSDVAIETVNVAPGGRQAARLLPLLKPTAVGTLNVVRPATIQVTVEQVSPSQHLLFDRAKRIHLMARDTALLGVIEQDEPRDLTEYLAAWVTPFQPKVELLLSKAARRLTELQSQGQRGKATPALEALRTRQQVKSLFMTLKEDVQLTYVSTPLSLGAQAGQISQRVRLPSQVLDLGGAANCVDGTVLYASLMEASKMEPLIVIVPGHIFLGWRTGLEEQPYEFLETTLTSAGDFEFAQTVAMGLYRQFIQAGLFGRSIDDPQGFARQVDVAACRAKGIYPLE